MGLINSIKNFIYAKGYEDDDDYLNDYEFDNVEDDIYTRRRSEDISTTYGSKYNDNRRSSRERDDRSRSMDAKRGDTVELPSRATTVKYNENDKVYTISALEDPSIIVSTPEHFDDAPSICDLIKQRKSVVVNMENVEGREAQRIMDFLVGVAYSVKGDIQPITNRIYVMVPENVNVTDQTKEHLKSQGIFPSLKMPFTGR